MPWYVNPIGWGGWGWWGTLDQWTWYADTTYLYTVYGVDNNWESIRITRDLITETITWIQSWVKPTDLVTVQWLTYS